jgi:hypothetical protein
MRVTIVRATGRAGHRVLIQHGLVRVHAVRRLFCTVLSLLVTGLASAQAEHIALPPVNLGATSFMDGAGGPGLLAREALGLYEAQRVADQSGNTVPGPHTVLAFTSVNHLAYGVPVKVLGGYWGFEILVPAVDLQITTPVGNAHVVALGDITFSPLVWQAPNTKLFGRPFFQRLDLDMVAPTGEYRSTALASAGNNVWSVNPYYAFTWLATSRIETSWRLHYLWNSANDSPGPGYEATTIQPGQAIHINAAVSVATVSWLRLGVASYYLRQITNSRADGRSVTGSEEQVAAIGPGLLATAGHFMFLLNGYGEFAAQNRTEGARLSAVAMGVW